MLVGKICNIKIFHLVDEVCNLVSTKIKPVHIISTMFSYT